MRIKMKKMNKRKLEMNKMKKNKIPTRESRNYVS